MRAASNSLKVGRESSARAAGSKFFFPSGIYVDQTVDPHKIRTYDRIHPKQEMTKKHCKFEKMATWRMFALKGNNVFKDLLGVNSNTSGLGFRPPGSNTLLAYMQQFLLLTSVKFFS